MPTGFRRRQIQSPNLDPALAIRTSGRQIKELQNRLNGGAWTGLTYAANVNSWNTVNSTPGFYEPAARIDGSGVVHFRGLLSLTGTVTNSTSLFSLPPQFWPARTVMVFVSGSNLGRRLDFQSNGQCINNSGVSLVSPEYYTLETISYSLI